MLLIENQCKMTLWDILKKKHWHISSVTRQNGESQNRGNKKPKQTNFPKNKHFLPPDTHTSVCVSWDRKCSFSGKFWRAFSCYFRFETLLFALLPTIYKFIVDGLIFSSGIRNYATNLLITCNGLRNAA